jgi:hypothetical protein
MNRKFFKHQSGEVHAVQAELNQVLESTRVLAERVKSDPPPKESLFPIDGTYLLSSSSGIHPGLIEKVDLKK